MSQTCGRVDQLLRRGIQSWVIPKPSKVALAHSSWFRLRDQGMKDFELLARGSGFMVHGPSTGAAIAVISGHVAAPHRFRAYFPQEWLEHVRDGDCRSMLETRCGEETKGWTNHALSGGFRHAKLDVAAFLLDEESRDRLGDVEVLTIGEEVKTGAEVSINGFRLIGETGSGSEGLVGVSLNGVVKEVTGWRGFIDTRGVESEMGMCGGPVIQDGKCVGLLEGLVPKVNDGERAGEIHARVGGCSVYVGARELQMFVEEVENEGKRGAEGKG